MFLPFKKKLLIFSDIQCPWDTLVDTLEDHKKDELKKEFFIGPYNKTKLETETDSILEDTVLKIEDDASEGMKIFTFELKKVHSFHSQKGLNKNTKPVLQRIYYVPILRILRFL